MKATNQSGQTLIIIVLVMLIALAIGVGISTTFISHIRNLTNTDSSNRAVAVAEAGVEKMLVLPMATLEGYINFGNCGAECIVNIIGDDGVEAKAEISLSYLGRSADPFPVDLSVADISEVNLKGYPDNTNFQVCWNEPPSGDVPSITGMFFYGTVGSYAVDNYAYNSTASLNGSNGFDTAAGSGGYSSCFTVTGRVNPVIFRLKAVYNSVEAFIVPAVGATLPSQGIVVTSQGMVDDQVKKVVAIKSDPHLPGEFDYVLYSKSATDPLSN
ncbi:MAG: hypothetical protein UU77_C0010G0021 [candidate division WWE3 bacterium GW2011_GWC1_41_7]|uniref:Type 4 fimbrial biogenesis protein PilX N-terminal domain-containing protein n=3 Tax=Katanobacteria TaxID=422282 RepID=A0A0G0X9D2_UNCKA|nr:MAG: hypothetical protein UU77_C0010G0021 [candidate division WWE3 bacterium GW2011_GWC1_41_7]KKS21750.1 MAG: hypothetical protein UU80_C0021G0021 [candidate division WWE3 bacterium GW2011_GWA1_41_8]OGC56498.1 MAG: hypothetical protein A2976_02815 [candidate division WWE3 bacterium RIFCSPLOWO2_01_FULL_41_9]